MSDAMGLPGGPAFPISIPGCGDNGCWGMSLRDWFAGQALGGVISTAAKGWGTIVPEGIAQNCYLFADAMLAEREKGKTG